MTDFIAEYYLWIKAFHIVAVISWMAGMLYLPRLFVYHCQVDPDSEASEKFMVMERKLLRIIINPAMILALISGTMLYFTDASNIGGWFYAKLVLVLIMLVIHGMLARYRMDFAVGKNRKTEKFYRIINEVPAILMIGIVILVVVKPW